MEKQQISKKNAELVEKFGQSLCAKGSIDKTAQKRTAQLSRICGKFLKVDLDKATKADIERAVAELNRNLTNDRKRLNQWDKVPTRAPTDETKADYRRTIKQFYYWFEDEDERFESDKKDDRTEARKLYKYVKKGFTARIKLKKADPATILTDEEIDKVVENGCRTPKEKAIIMLLDESGFRAGEFLNIRLRDLKVNGNCVEVSVDGKTGRRGVTLVKSMSLLTRWLEVHPLKDDPDSFLWLGESRRYKEKLLGYAGLRKIINKAFKKAEVNKRKNPHWFRHSRASKLAPYFTEQVLCTYMGWELGSDQVRRYVHLANRQIDQAVKKYNGILDKEEVKPVIRKCSCGEILNGVRYCAKCGKPADVVVLMEDREKAKQVADDSLKVFLNEIAKDPKIMQAFMNFKKKMST